MEAKVRAEVNAAVDRLKDEMIETLIDLVQIPSVVGSEGAAQDFMCRQYAQLDLQIDTFEADKKKIQRHPAYVESEFSFEVNYKSNGNDNTEVITNASYIK